MFICKFYKWQFTPAHIIDFYSHEFNFEYIAIEIYST